MADKVVKHDDIIEDGVFQPTIKEAQLLLVELNKIEAGFKSISAATGKSISGNKLSNAKEIESLATDLKKVDDIEKGLNETEKARIRITQQITNATRAENLEVQKLKIQLSEKNKTTKEAAREELGLNTEYQKQSKRLIELRIRYKDLVLAQKGGTFEAKLLSSQIQVLDTRLKEVDASTGQFQRNVGNYQSGFGKFYGLLKTAANIIPGLGISGLLLLGYDSFVKVVDALSGAFKINTEAINDNHKALESLREERNKSIKATQEANAKELLAQGKITEADIERFAVLDKLQDDNLDAQKTRDEELKKRAGQLGVTLKEFNGDLVVDTKKTSLSQLESIKDFYDQKKGIDAINFLNTRARGIAANAEIAAIDAKAFAEKKKEDAKNAEKEAERLKKEREAADKARRATDKATLDRFKEINEQQKKSIAEVNKELENDLKESNKNRVFSTKEFSDERLKAETDAIISESEFRISTEEHTQEEIYNIRAKAAKDIEDLNKESEKKKKEALEKEIDLNAKSTKTIIEAISEGLDARREKEIKSQEQIISDKEKAVSDQTERANLGLENTLLFEKQKKEEAALELKELEERQAIQKENAQLGDIFLEFLKGYAKGGDTAHAASRALTDTLLARGIKRGLASFYIGTEDTGTVSDPIDSKGGRYAIIHDNERIMTKEQNKLIGDMSNDELAQLAYRTSLQSEGKQIDRITVSTNGDSVVVNMLASKVDYLIEAVKNKREYSVHWDSYGARVEEVVENGMKNTYRKVTTGKSRI